MCGPSRSSGSSALRRVARNLAAELVGIFRMELALSQTKSDGTTSLTGPIPTGAAVTIEGETTTSYPLSPRNRVKRMHERGSYDRATIHGLLDASMLCHVSYVVDGQPYCTPTLFWREGNRLYWHGSSASRMLRNQSAGQPVCLTVTHMDAFVLARTGFNHSIDYRSVMAFGHARLLEDEAERRKALVTMVDRLFPGRTARLRASTRQEVKATAIVWMQIERASAKIRGKGLVDDEEDYDLPI